MICPKCGQENTGKYCSNCGEALLFIQSDSNNGKQKNEQYCPENDNTNAYSNGVSRGEDRPEVKGAAQSRREKKGASRKRGSSKSRGSSGSTKSSGKSSDKRIIKEIKQRDSRIHSLERKVEALNPNQSSQRRRERARHTEEGSAGQNLKDIAVSGAVGATVLCSRLMQLASFLLMVYIVYLLSQSFWTNGQALGNIGIMVTERNYGLAAYTAFAGFLLFWGIIWSLWILTRKDGGGNVRLKKYDTGRGFIPFIIYAAVFFLIPIALGLMPETDQIVGLPQVSVDAHVWQSAAAGLTAALAAVDARRNTLLFCSLAGLILSTIRKILRV